MRKLICLLPWMVLAGAAYGQVRSADVLYTHYDDAPTRGYKIGDEVFVPLSDVARWDWSVTTKSDLAFVKAEGVQVMVPTRNINGRVSLPLVKAVRQAGGVTRWDESTQTMRVYADLSSITVQNGEVKFFAPFATIPRISIQNDPKRLVIDLPGCSIGAKTTQNLDSTAQVTQPRPDETRITITAEDLPEASTYRGGATHSFDYQVPVAPEPKPVTPVTQPPVIVTPPPIVPPTQGDQDTSTVQQPTNTVPLLPINLVSEDEKGLEIEIPLSVAMSGAAQARRPQPEILELTLPGVAVMLPDDLQIQSPTIKSVTRSYSMAGTVVTFEFVRPMGAQIVTDGNTIRISVIKPNITGTLAGKVIVVDPGHGGHDSGAKGGGVMEKDLNLINGKLIASLLTQEGATVILTRSKDVFIPLSTRAKLANDSNADLFISCHINSTGGSGTQSGSITFHHKGNEVAKLLAECIHREIVKVSGLPNIGVWSDGKIYQSGFAVLRETHMPGVLLELGFINSASDRKRLVTSDFQTSIAAAVVKGIKVFLGDGN